MAGRKLTEYAISLSHTTHEMRKVQITYTPYVASHRTR